MKAENRELLIRAAGMLDVLYSVAPENEKTPIEIIANFIDIVLGSEVNDESNS